MIKVAYLLTLFILPMALCANPVLPSRLLTSEKAPYNFLVGNEVTGLTVDVVHALYPELTLNIELMPWPRAMETANHQPNVLLFTMAKTAERETQGYHFIGPVSRRYHWLYSMDSQQNLKDLDEVKQKRLIIVGLRGGWLSNLLQTNGLKLQQVGDYQQGLQMLKKNYAQLWLSTEIEEQVLFDGKIDKQPLFKVLQVGCSDNFIALSPGSDDNLVRELQERFARFKKSPTSQAILKRWQYKTALPLQYSATIGYHLPEDGIERCTPF